MAGPKRKPTPKPTPTPKPESHPAIGWVEEERKIGKGTSINDREAAAKARLYAGDNEYVNPAYGPIAGSAKPKPKQDITKIPGFKFGRGTE